MLWAGLCSVLQDHVCNRLLHTSYAPYKGRFAGAGLLKILHPTFGEFTFHAPR
jgi:hypothetical protein